MPTAGERALQETLHILLSRLAAAMEHVKNWPSEQQASQQQSSSQQASSSSKTAAQQSKKSSGTTFTSSSSTNVHVAATSTLIQHIRDVITAVERVESTIKKDGTVRQSLRECLIPLDLLDVLDSSMLHPDCFIRGLLREALGQLAGLRRRKLALELLGNAVQSGMRHRQQPLQKQQQQPQPLHEGIAPTNKRVRSPGPAGPVNNNGPTSDEDSGPPPAKRAHLGD